MFSYFEHPNTVCMSYFEHASFSSSIGISLLIGSMQAFVHALFPSMFMKSSSKLSTDLNKKLLEAGCKN